MQKSQDENTIGVTDGLARTLDEMKAELPAGVRLEPIQDASRPIRVAVKNVRQTLLEGAALTVLIVFLFLNSWRSTVITGLTLPIALIGTFLFMHAFGFTINMITLMALSLCVGLLIDDAIVVRENIVRHVQMGKSPYQASLEGTQEIGLAVLATTFSIVAVFLPIGFMGGIIGKFFHEFGITIVAAVLISMFVSFTLDPMLSSIWHDPEIDKHGQPRERRTLYDRTIGRVTGAFDIGTEKLAQAYQGLLRWSLAHKLATLGAAAGIFVASVVMLPLLGTEFVPKADFSETQLSFHTPVGSSLEVTEAKARQVEAILRELPEVQYTLSTINTGVAQGKIYASVYVRLVDRHLRQRSVDQLSGVLRQRLLQVPGITVTHVGLVDAVGGNKQIEFSILGPDQQELERLARLVMERIRGTPGLVDLDSSVKDDKPTIQVQVQRDAASDLGLSVGQIAASLRTLVAGQTVGTWRAPGRPDLRRQRAPGARCAHGAAAAGSPALRHRPERRRQRPHRAPGPGGAGARRHRAEPGQPARPDARSGDQRQRARPRRRRGVGRHPQAAGGDRLPARLPLAVQRLGQEHGRVLRLRRVGAGDGGDLHLHDPGQPVQELPAAAGADDLAAADADRRGAGADAVRLDAVDLLHHRHRDADGAGDQERHPAGRFRHPRMREQGMERAEALLLAARVRLRPILMTTLAMIFGMVPLAFALSEGSEQRAPMGQAVIGGVITSSLLTLVVVPVVYCYLDDFAAWIRRLRNAGEAARTPRF